jgi:hypothetical protein
MLSTVRFVLVHSPVVGPATWRPVAEVLASAGHDVAVPDLRAAALTGEPEAVVTAAVAVTAVESAVMVGHSGAGFFLPLIAGRAVPAPVRLVFVDAGVPPCEGQADAAGDFLEQLRSLAIDGRLPRWSTWWGKGVMEALVPSERFRFEIEAEMLEVPLALFEARVELRAGWCNRPGAFLLLSEAYRRDSARASSLGWPVVERLGNHLDIVNDPQPIARAIVELVS